MSDFDLIIKKAEKNLNDSLRHFEEAPNHLAQEFTELKLQSCIFQYDISVEMIGIIRNGSEGFARSVALKGLVLRLFEYDQILNKRLIPRLLSLAQVREILIDKSTIKDLRKQWKSELKQLQTWHDVRNQAAGHYGENIANQVSLLKTLSTDGVMSVVGGFLNFNMGLLAILRDAGNGVTNCSSEAFKQNSR